MFLLDTNVISQLRHLSTTRMNQQVNQWLQSIHLEDAFLSVFSLFELEKGILLKQRKDPLQANILRQWLSANIMPVFKDRVLLFDSQLSELAASLHVPDPKPEIDSFIAATALHHGFTLVTRNVQDFESMNVSLLNPWEFFA